MKQTTKTHSDSSNNLKTSDKRRKFLQAIESLKAESRPSAKINIAIAEAYFRLALLPDTGLSETADYLYKATNYDAYHPKYYYHLGRVAYLLGDFANAVQFYRKSLELAPDNQRITAHLALTLLEQSEEEKDIGNSLLDGIGYGIKDGTKDAVAALDELINNRNAAKNANEKKEDGGETADASKSSQPPTRRKVKSASTDNKTIAPENVRWKNVWQVIITEQLTHASPSKSIIQKQLDFAKGQETNLEALVVLYLLFLLEPAFKDVAISAADAPPLKDHINEPSVKMLLSAIELIKSEKDNFIQIASKELKNKTLPPEYIWMMHYQKYGPGSDLRHVDSLKLLDMYPDKIVEGMDSFKELKIAILDGYAKAEFQKGNYAISRLLWQSALEFDPVRVNLAHNLALLAARTRDLDDYQTFWSLAAESRYLQAAAAGNLHVLMIDRITLHRGFFQQSKQRYLHPDKEMGKQKPEDLKKWMADGPAFKAWLDEWDLYYINARMQFRSPVHLLGGQRDSSPEEIKSASESLMRSLDRILRSRQWAGIQAFCDLAQERIQEAAKQAVDDLAKSRDPYYGSEKTLADGLAVEAIERGFALFHLLRMLLDAQKHGEFPDLVQGIDIGSHLLLLPWENLQPICLARGIIEEDTKLSEIFENHLMAFISRAKPSSEGAVREGLIALEKLSGLLPQNFVIFSVRCKILLENKQCKECYQVALETIPCLQTILEQIDDVEKGLIDFLLARGLIEEDADLNEDFESHLDALKSKAKPSPESDVREVLTALEKLSDRLPQNFAAHYRWYKTFLENKRDTECYQVALETIQRLQAIKGQEEGLINLLEAAATSIAPENTFQPKTLDDLKISLKTCHAILDEFPHAHQVRLFMAHLMLNLADNEADSDMVGNAQKMLEEGLPLAFTEKQRQEIQEKLGEAKQHNESVGLVKQVKEIADSVQAALGNLDSHEKLLKAKQVVKDSLKSLETIKQSAKEKDLKDVLQQVDSLQVQLIEVMQKLEGPGG